MFICYFPLFHLTQRPLIAIPEKQNRWLSLLIKAIYRHLHLEHEYDFLYKKQQGLVCCFKPGFGRRGKAPPGSPNYPVIDIAYMSQGKGFSDFVKNILCLSIQFPTQIQEIRSPLPIKILSA